jgi:hypothetical protein
MTEDELIALGEYCEQLLSQDYFATLVQQFDAQCYTQMMESEPHEKMKRESVYCEYRGCKAFLDHLRAFVDQKNQTLQRNAAPSQEDAHIPGID